MVDTGNDIRARDWGIIQVLREGWRLYHTQFTTVVLVVLCAYLPANVAVALVPTNVQLAPFGARSMQSYSVLSCALGLLAGATATVALAYLAENALAGRSVTWREALRYGLALWPSVLLTGLLAGGIIALFTLLLIFPGIVWALYYAFWIYVVALRGLKGRDALGYSQMLVKEQWGRTWRVLLAAGIAATVVSLVFASLWGALPAQPVLYVLIKTAADVIGALFTLIVAVFFLNADYRRQAPYKPRPIVG